MMEALSSAAQGLLANVGLGGHQGAVAVLACFGLFQAYRATLGPAISGFLGYFLPRGPAVRGGLKGRWAIVTGSTDGIGKAVAFELAKKHNMNIMLVSRTKTKLASVAAEIADQTGVETRTVPLDFNSAADDDFVAPVMRVAKDLDVAVLVNNAGMSYDHAEYFEALEPAKIQALVNLNVLSLSKLTHAVLPQMIEAKSGAIVNVSSASSLVSEPLYAVYSATKAYVNNFSRALHTENASRGVTVHSALPFFVTTKLSKLRHSSFFVAKEAAYARALVNDIGHESLRVNYWTHAIQAHVISIAPEFVLKKFLMGNGLSIRKRAHAKKGAKKE